MKRSEKVVFVFEILLFIILFFNIFVLNIFNYITLPFLLLIFFLLMVFTLGFEKDNFKNRKDIILTVLIFLISYYLFTYISGIFFGFVRTGYSLKFINIIRNVWPVLFLIVTKELLRYEINVKGQEKTVLLVISTFIFVFVDVSNVLYLYNLNDYGDILKIIEITALPSLTENILLTYLSIKGGYKVNLIYQFIMKIPTYLLPIFPDVGTYLDIIFRLLLPCIISYRVIISLKKRMIGDVRASMFLSKTVSYFILIFLVIVIYLTSGIFKYYALTIGSGSMEPKISKGDIVVIEKIKDYSKIRVGDVAAFKKESKVIVHRIIKISKEQDYYVFITKGDANDAQDSYPVYEKEIIGVVRVKIKYLGYPTVWLNELVNRKGVN